jgi:CheY-like chemotaxis protein
MIEGEPHLTAGSPLAASKRVILLVEDDLDTLEALTEAIADRGIEVVTAVDGTEALVALRAGLRPVAILLDSWMPNLDGRAVLRELRGDPELTAIPVVWMSAERGEPPAGTGRLQKPIALEHLNAVLRTLCPD